MANLYCPLSGTLQRCVAKQCMLWDLDANCKGGTGMCGIKKFLKNISEIRAKLTK